jgi:uncharacterized protein (TIGR03790 family)
MLDLAAMARFFLQPSRRRPTLNARPPRFGCRPESAAATLALLILAAFGRPAQAGGGPENVLLVVNSLRNDSLTLANHYAALRQIPPSNIVYLQLQGSTETIGVDAFRSQILEPIFAEIGRRRLHRQIDYIVYSAGFPYSVDFSPDATQPVDQVRGNRGSLTGLTYLSQLVRSRDPSFVFSPANPRSNNFYGTTTQGFSSEYAWGGSGQRQAVGGTHYYLSTMLGYTDGRGNSVDEVVNYLRRAALADGTHPTGTIYLMRTEGEIRSSTRHGIFPQIAALIQQEGVGAEVVDGILPKGKDDVMGITTGRAALAMEKTPMTIRPGAIVDNLTSFGGDLRESAHQTPLTDFLRFGAAGASGTVMEPYAIQAKFPHPIVHVHYVRGATLAEAYYQSLASPYQMLIVGDPLCRPWAEIPKIAVDGVAPRQTVQDMLTLTPRSETLPVKTFRLFVDGRHIQDCRPGELFEIDTTKVGDGYHELRIVGIEESPIESQGRLIIPVHVANQGGQIDAAVQPRVVDSSGRVQCFVNAPGSRSIYVFHNRRPLGQVNGHQGTVLIDVGDLGRGPVVLTAVALGTKGGDKVFSQPLPLSIQ